MKGKNNDMARRVSVRPLVAYPAVTVGLVVSAALAWTPFAASPVMALDAAPIPTATATAGTTASPTISAPTTAAPSPTTAAPSPTTAAPVSTTPVPSPIPGPSPKAVMTPAGVPVDHHVLAWVGGTTLQAHYFPVDAAVLNASQYQTIRVRFTMHNTGTAPLTTAPQLEYRPDGATGYVVVPQKPLNGIPFHVVREWVPSHGLNGGSVQGPLSEDIPVAKLRTGNAGGGLAMIGHHSMSANPDRSITLPSDSFTEQEFTIQLTMDAKYLTSYELRLTDGHSLLAGTQVATIKLGPKPAVGLSPGQRKGVAVESPKPARGTGAVK